MDLHRRIRTLRLRRGMTGMRLAERAGVSPSYISLIEHGLKIPAEGKAVAIARALGEPEGPYRTWAATARLSKETQEAMRCQGALGSSNATFGLDQGLTTLPPEPHRPPGRPVTNETRGFIASSQLLGMQTVPLLRIPLLAPGPVPEESPPDESSIEAIIEVDGRLLERDSAEGLVALRLNSHNARLVHGLLRALDLVVIDRLWRRLDPSNIYAWRLDDGLTLSRAVFVNGGAMLYATGDGQSPVAVDATTPESLTRLLYGTVIWMSRRWVQV
ncbi:MAG: helix-turn-helix transcriptional regulator [Acidobacteriota bacterium]